jgi:hypothetical protein
LLSALLICALWQAIWSVPALPQIPLANASSRGAWSSTDIYPVSAVVNYGATNYNALTKNVGMTPYIAVSDGAREDPANDVRFTLGNWAVFSAENPRWTTGATRTAATPQFNLLKNTTTPDGLHRPAELTAAEPKHQLQAPDVFRGCNNLGQQVDPFYQSGHLGADCGTTIRTRTDYGVIGSMLILSLFK